MRYPHELTVTLGIFFGCLTPYQQYLRYIKAAFHGIIFPNDLLGLGKCAFCSMTFLTMTIKYLLELFREIYWTLYGKFLEVGNVSTNFAAAKNGQVGSNFAAAKNGQMSSTSKKRLSLQQFYCSKNCQSSSNFSAAKNGKVGSHFAAATNGQVSINFAAAKSGQDGSNFTAEKKSQFSTKFTAGTKTPASKNLLLAQKILLAQNCPAQKILQAKICHWHKNSC